MEKDENLILMGQDIAEYGGVFKVTEGFAEKFGVERVRNTPICESAIIEVAMGLSICKCIAFELLFALNTQRHKNIHHGYVKHIRCVPGVILSAGVAIHVATTVQWL